MNKGELNPYPQINFTCDSCGEEYESRTAYSLSLSLSQLNQHPTYCINCVRFTEKELEELTLTKSKAKLQSRTKWEAPPTEVSENLSSLNLDKRSLTKTGRIHQLGTRVKKEFLEQLKSIAYQERLKYVEVLEKALHCYEKHRKK